MAMPDGPGLNPRQMFKWLKQPYVFFRENAARYGDTFTLHFPGIGQIVFISDPEDVQQFFKANKDVFETGDTEANHLLASILGANSLLVLRGSKHIRHRRLLTPPFHGERMRAYGLLMSRITQQIIETWPLGTPVAMQDAMQRLSLDVIIQVVFGVTEAQSVVKFRVLVQALLDAINPAILHFRFLRHSWGKNSPWGRFVRASGQLDRLILAEITQRRHQNDPSREDILTLLLAARDEQGHGMSDQEIRDELLTLLLAGHETTALALTWGLYWIHRDPRILEALHQEMDGLDTSHDAHDVARLPYLHAVCQEILRLHPIVPEVTRGLGQPFLLKGYDLPAGTVLAPSIYLTHRRAALYPEPDVFRPERFLEREFSPWEYLPFGGGGRKCIGWAFALYEMKMVLFTVLSQIHLRLEENQIITPQRRNLTVGPVGGVRMIPTMRRKTTLALARAPVAQ